MLVPKVAKFFSSIPSTNAALLTDVEARPQLPHGSVYLTREQPAGKGQGANTWHSSPGDNLALSLLLRPDCLSADQIFALSAFASLAVSDTLVALLPPHLSCLVSVKWPNDVYVGNRKIAGILIQNGLRGNQVHLSVIGIGINVNERAFPAQLVKTATSLRLLLGCKVALDEVLQSLFSSLTERYEAIEQGWLTRLRKAYRNRLYQIDRPANYLRVSDGQPFRASITGINQEGLLELCHENGRLEHFDVQQLRYLRG